MLSMLKRLWRDKSGDDTLEYALLVALIALGIIATIHFFGSSISNAYGRVPVALHAGASTGSQASGGSGGSGQSSSGGGNQGSSGQSGSGGGNQGGTGKSGSGGGNQGSSGQSGSGGGDQGGGESKFPVERVPLK
jgi:Flp pilus assembly pilin Flp